MIKINNKYSIWDKVTLISNTENYIYIIYSITINYNWSINYTIWKDTDYESVSEWQIQLHIPPEPIWLTTE